MDLAAKWTTGVERGGVESVEGDFHGFVAARSAALFRGATFLLGSLTKKPIAVDLTGLDLASAKAHFLKAGLKLGTVAKVNSPGCTPTSVVELTPHSPKIVTEGDTVNVKLCAG